MFKDIKVILPKLHARVPSSIDMLMLFVSHWKMVMCLSVCLYLYINTTTKFADARSYRKRDISS